MKGHASSWSELPIKARRQYISRAVKIMAARHRAIATVVTQETGRPIAEIANQEVAAALEMVRYLAKMTPRWLRPERFRYWRPGFWLKSNQVRFEPIGTVLVIGPSNFPFSLPVMQTCAALLCGNAVVLKPSERCPRTAALIRELFAAAQFPSGALEVVDGGPNIAEEWIARKQVQKVVFTGGSETGRRVAAVCGRAFKPCILELGGGSTAIVCEDADLSLASRGIAWSAFYANGRSCVGTKRVLVHTDVGRRLSNLLLQEMGRIKAGDPLDPETEIGMVTGKVGELIHDAIGKRAQLWSRSGPLGPDTVDFQAPLLVTSASLSMRLMHEEIPFPLLAIREVSSDEQALREANQFPAGLGASVWSRNVRRARTLANSIEAGMVWINDSIVGMPQIPWGGRKQSGWGRIFSRYGFLELTHVKVISAERRRLSRSKIWWFPYSRRNLDIFQLIHRWYSQTSGAKILKKLIAAISPEKSKESKDGSI